MGIGDRIKVVRGNLSRDDFGDRIGVGKTAVHNYETKDMVPKGRVIQKIVEVFGVSVGWLLTGQGEPWPSAGGDGLYLAGKTEEKVIDGVRIKAQVFSPETAIKSADGRRGEVREEGVDPFGAAVSALREIFDHNDPLTRAALESNLALFKVSSKIISEYGKMRDEFYELKGKVAELERIIREHRPPEGTVERRRNWDQIKPHLNHNEGRPAEERSEP